MQALKQVRSRWNRLSGFQQVAVLLIAVGIFFRFANLDGKVLWHDEVYTNFRAAGYTRAEMDDAIFQDQQITASELRQFQRIKPGSTALDTVRSLALEDPQHPPPYFVVARWWMMLFGSSITADRLLPAVISLFSLPLMYALSLELFAIPTAALMATVLLALSPFDILFAQTARQYSLMTLATIAGSWLLLRSIRTRRWSDWGLYTGATALGLYTQPLFVLAPIAHGVYLAGLVLKERVLPPAFSWEHKRYWQAGMAWLGAIALALLLFSPWIQVIQANFATAANTTDWTRATVSLWFLVNLWVLSFTSLFMDLNIYTNPPLNFLLRIPIVVLIGVALYAVYRRTRFSTWFFVLTSAWIPFLTLVLLDLIGGGRRSSVTRYLIGCYPAIQLAVAYWLAGLQTQPQVFWRKMMLPTIAALSIASCTVSLFSETWWHQIPSFNNAAIANYIATVENPVIISDMGNDFTNTANLISLSVAIPEETPFYLMTEPPDFSLAPLSDWQNSTLLVLWPSSALIDAVPNDWQMDIIKPEWNLWQLSPL